MDLKQNTHGAIGLGATVASAFPIPYKTTDWLINQIALFIKYITWSGK